MTPEDKEELKALVREVLKEEDEAISPLVRVTYVFKDVDIEEGADQVIVDSKLHDAETVKVTRIIKWSSIHDIIETSKRDQDLFETKKLYKLILDIGPMYCEIKNIKEFEKQWEEAILAYGFI